MADVRYSIVEYFGAQNHHSCGYCKGSDTNFSHGMWAYSLTVQDYQGLIDRGWRRSGCYCYKPSNDKTCCPLYTIKCEAMQFKISKSQKKILKRMAKFLRNELKKEDITDKGDADMYDHIDVNIAEVPNYNKYYEKAEQKASKIQVSSVKKTLDDRLQSTEKMDTSRAISVPISQVKETGSAGCVAMQVTPPADTSTTPRMPCLKAKTIRKQRKQNKMLAQGKSVQEIEAIFNENKRQNHTKSLDELFDEINSASGKLELRLVRTSPMSSAYLKTSKQSFEVYKKYQTTVHGFSPEKVTEQQFTRFLVKSPLQMRLVSVNSNEMLRTLDASTELYKKYQMTVHGEPPEECTKLTFINFLVKSSLQQWKPDDGPPKGYGSFHEQYWLNNELIAVAVIDILPSCLSSVYFFYDPAYSHLSLGTFSSLRELYLTRQLNKVAKNLQYYYMGFYIHSCPKMRYKARMSPSKLLCPETYKWFDIEHCIAKLEKEKYSRFNDDIDAIDEDGIVDIDEVSVSYDKIAMPYRIYKIQNQGEITKHDEEEVEEYATLVGRKCAMSMLLYRE